jgi:hypothetical protein
MHFGILKLSGYSFLFTLIDEFGISCFGKFLELHSSTLYSFVEPKPRLDSARLPSCPANSNANSFLLTLASSLTLY